MIRARSWRDTSAAWKTHGAPSAPRPIMTAAQPVALVMAHASSAVRTSPLPSTGIATASTTRAMISQGATPLNCCERVRGWTVIASTPSPSAIRAISTAFTVRSSQPPRILIVRSTPIAFRRVRKTTAAPSGSRISAAPWPLATIFATGRPMLRSIASAPAASSCRAASARTSGSAPRSCIAIGCSSGRNRASSAVRTLPTTRPRASISSLVSGPAPHSRATSLNGALVIAAIGARRRSSPSEGLLVDTSALHDQLEILRVLQDAQVPERVARDDEEVGVLSGLDGADPVGHPEERGVDLRRREQDLHRLHHLRLQLELDRALDHHVAQQVGARADPAAGAVGVREPLHRLLARQVDLLDLVVADPVALALAVDRFVGDHGRHEKGAGVLDRLRRGLADQVAVLDRAHARRDRVAHGGVRVRMGEDVFADCRERV